VLIQEPKYDALPVAVIDRADVIDAGGNPYSVGSFVSVDDTSYDGLGHSFVVSIHDCQKRGLDA